MLRLSPVKCIHLKSVALIHNAINELRVNQYGCDVRCDFSQSTFIGVLPKIAFEIKPIRLQGSQVVFGEFDEMLVVLLLNSWPATAK